MKWWSSMVAVLMMAIASPALARTQLELSDTPVQNAELSAGPMRVRVNYTNGTESWENELRYQIYYNNRLAVDVETTTSFQASVKLLDLDNSGDAEVIVETFSGGAHCCTSFAVYHWTGDRLVQANLEMLDGGGGMFEDLDQDGRLEFVSYDNAFLYAFSSYAGSFAPSLIFNFENGRFVDMTYRYAQELRSQAWQMYQAIVSQEGETGEINGVLAGYVAQKIRLGEYQQGWEFMLARYDRTSDWGLEVDTGAGTTQYRNFPAALRAFLIRWGYLTPQGQPNPRANRAS